MAVPFARLVRIEWGKATDTRAARWLLAITGIATLGLIAAPLIATGSIDQTMENYLAFATLAPSVLLPVIGILVLTGEWSQRTALTTFTQEPRRSRVVAAKLVAVSALTAIGVAVSYAVGVGGYHVAGALGHDLVGGTSAGVIVGAGISVALTMAIGVALAVVIQNSAAAIVANFALPTVFGLLAVPLGRIGEWFDPNHAESMMGTGDFSEPVKLLFVCALWILVPLVAGLIRTERRDIA